MSYRYTNTEKWSDNWFLSLKPIEKLLFVYICDNCDIAGFIEVNYKRWASDIGTNQAIIQGALKGLQRGLILSKDENCLYIRNFLKHQKNLPLNQNNKAHTGILKRFSLYSHKFDIKEINEFIEGASKGLQSPTGNGNGNGKEKGVKGEKQKRMNYPCIEDVVKYFDDNGYLKETAEKAFNYYSVNSWHDSKGNEIKNWKQKMIAVWFKPENRKQINNSHQLNTPKEWLQK